MSLVVVRAVGMVTVQDFGRPGHMHEGLAPGGALVPELLIAANRRAGNPDDVAAVEVLGALTLRALRSVVVATDRLPAREMAPGDEISVVSDTQRVAYLAVRGGIDAPVLLGSRSTQLSAGLGGLLRAGAEIIGGDASISAAALDAPLERGRPIRIEAGPDLECFGPRALDLLTSAVFTVLPSSDRVGTRLDGPRVPRTDRPELTRPMVRGAIEVPRDGQPIVLGPEHPTTGGYPVLGVVIHEDVGRLMVVEAGGTLTFVVRR